MSRLTSKKLSSTLGTGLFTTYNKEEFDTYSRVAAEDIYKKLAKLEDIEDEIGLNLGVLFKALKCGIWYKNEYGQIIKCCVDLINSYLSPNNNTLTGLCLAGDNHYFYFDAYNKAWALTKEELEDHKI